MKIVLRIGGSILGSPPDGAVMAAYAAVRTKDQDKIIDAAGVMTTACANCHVKYREKRNPADRCR